MKGVLLFVLFFLILLHFKQEKVSYSSFPELKGYSDLLVEQKKWEFTSGGIPKIIIKTGEFKKEHMPDAIIGIFKKLQTDNPGFNLYYFDKDDRDIFMKEIGLHIYFKKIIPGAYKADFFRVCILYHYGGCYSDLGQVIMVPLHQIIKEYSLVLVRDIDHCNIFNSFMCTVKNNSFFKEVTDTIIENIKNEYYGETPFDITGPSVLGKIYTKYTSSKKLIVGETVAFNVKTLILRHDLCILNLLLRGFSPITYNGKDIIHTSFKDYKYIVYTSQKIPKYNHLWHKRKVFI